VIAIQIPPRLRRPLLYVGYIGFALSVAVLTLYGTLPRDRIKDTLESALSADPSLTHPLGIGMDVTIGNVGLTLFSGAGFVAKDAVLKTRPTGAEAKPARFFVDDATVHMGVIGAMLNRPTYRWKGHALSGTVTGKLSLAPDDAHLKLELANIVLNGVLGIQQAVGLPLEGTLNGKLDFDMPKQLYTESNGTLELDGEEMAVGDGKAKLSVPNDPFLAAGLTIPRIKLGKLVGRITVEKGRARLEDVRMHSADADVTVEGFVELHDPLTFSFFHLYVKFKPSEALTKREPTLDLLMNAATAAKRSDGWLGFILQGSPAAPSFVPSKEPPVGVTTRTPPPETTRTVAPPPVPAATGLHTLPPPTAGEVVAPPPPAEPVAPPPPVEKPAEAAPPPVALPPPPAEKTPERSEKAREERPGRTGLYRGVQPPAEEPPAQPAEGSKNE
jgi:type II secretion system protein N